MKNHKQYHRFFVLSLLYLVGAFYFAPLALAEHPDSNPAPNLITDRALGLTSYQQAGRYDPRFDVKTDVVMVYGTSDAVLESLPEWREKSGSKIAIMTGIAWGEYQEYLYGKADGVDHWDDAQVLADGSPMLHGPQIPYLSPSVSFTDYLTMRLRKLIDAGIDEIYLEEPEFWAFTGFGDSFKREWQIFYNEDWIRPDSSCDAQYRASKLKQYLYRRALDRVGTALKEYSLKTYNRPLKLYVATHSLVSYAQIQMVSPESSLLDLPGVDGIIVQTWTGTARFGNFYNGAFGERTFEVGMLEYGVMQEMMRGTGKRVYFLNDPVEDNPGYSWDDYKTNYLCTLVSSLMRSETHYYEVAPWPSRVFLGLYPSGSPDATRIPQDYATTLSLVFQQLRDMDQPEVQWLDASEVNSDASKPDARSGATEGIGVLLADSTMYQRANPTAAECGVNDPSAPMRPTVAELQSLSDFTSLTFPLIKHGVPVDIPVLDNVLRTPGYLDHYKILVLSYDFQKPSSPGLHATLADWVSRGGALIFVDSRLDAYNNAKDWWNTSEPSIETPGDHFLTSFGLAPEQASGKYPFGKGFVYLERKRPSYFGRSSANADEYRNLVYDAAVETGLDYIERNYFLKRRGPYLLAATLTESISNEPLTLKGRFVNLFDPTLSIEHEVVVNCGERAWLLDLDRVTASAPSILASSCRIESLHEKDERTVEIETTSVAEIVASSLVLLAHKPKSVLVDGAEVEEFRWDEETHTLFFQFPSDGKATILIEY